MFHVDYFKCNITERGRSKIVEEYTRPVTEINEGLIILSSVEKQDEVSPEEVAQKAVNEIIDLAEKIKIKNIVIHPFAHLFGELSTPQTAIQVLKRMELELIQKGFSTIRTPFGWFNTLEIKAKGHPLSRVARIITFKT